MQLEILLTILDAVISFKDESRGFALRKRVHAVVSLPFNNGVVGSVILLVEQILCVRLEEALGK